MKAIILYSLHEVHQVFVIPDNVQDAKILEQVSPIAEYYNQSIRIVDAESILTYPDNEQDALVDNLVSQIAQANGDDGICENCGSPCDYDGEICLCEDCEAKI